MINVDRTWITSDNHFGHTNIIKYCKRPFADVREMNEEMIEAWNNVVADGDVVFCLGDFKYGRSFSVSDFLPRLNGQVHLIQGNHDDEDEVSVAGFASVEKLLCDKDSYGNILTMCHYPMLVWPSQFGGKGLHFFGHVHSSPHKSFISRPGSYDVGVDNNGYRPIRLLDAINKARSHWEENRHLLEMPDWIKEKIDDS